MNKKVIAIAAAMAVILTSMAVAIPSLQGSDADFTGVTAAPVAYNKVDNVRAILYQDKVLMVDISGAATLDEDNLYKVEVSTASSYTDAKGIVVSPVAAVGGKIVINVDGKSTDGMTSLIGSVSDETTKTANLFVKVKTKAGLNVGSQILLTYKVTSSGLCAMAIHLYKNNDDGWDADSIGDTAYAEVSDVALQNRGINLGLNETQKTIQDMTSAVDTGTESEGNYTLTDPNSKLELIGWSKNVQRVDGTADIEAKTMIVEDLIYKAGDVGAIKNMGKTNLANEIALYAVYGSTSYSVHVQDHFEDTDSSWVTTNAEIKGTTSSSTSETKIATASVTPTISSIGYGILSIELENKSNNTNNYAFEIEAYGAITTGGAVEGDALTTEKVKITQISTNVYKISEVKSDLYIKIGVKSTKSAAGTLYFDSIKNTTSGAANLSLELHSNTKLDSDSTLKMDGTIYTTSDDGIRTYSSLINYKTLGNGQGNPISVKMDGSDVTSIDSRLSNTTLNLYDASGTPIEADSYDMALELNDGYYIYALQGTWKNGDNSVYTPWSLSDS